MRSWRSFSKVGCAVLALTGLALSMGTDAEPGPIGVAKRGPCQPAVAAITVPPGCENECTFWCTDPCKAVSVTPGKCLGQEGACSEFQDSFIRQMCRECTCPFGGGHCIDEGLYSSGTQTATNCVAAA